MLKEFVLAGAVALAAALPATAATVGAVSAVINSGGPGFGDIANTHNQSGLSANYVSGVTDFDSFVATTTHTSVFLGFEWFSNEPSTSASVTYDLGSTMTIDKMALWNEEKAGIGSLDLLVSVDGVSFSNLLGGLTPTNNPDQVDYLADVFSFAATAFRYIRLDMSGCPQPNGTISTYCAIGEVAFNSATAIPIPGTLPLLLVGLGGFGYAARRRKHLA